MYTWLHKNYCNGTGKKLPFVSTVNARSAILLNDTKSCVRFSFGHILADVCLNSTYFPVACFVITLCYSYCLFHVECAIVTFYRFYPDKCQTILPIQRRHLGINELQLLFMTNVNTFSAYTLTLIVIIANVSCSSALVSFVIW